MSINKLATELTLKTLLIETITMGIRYALLVRNNVDHPMIRSMNNEGMRCAANILASILPGICPAKVMNVFESLSEKDMDRYAWQGMDMNDVEKVLALICREDVETDDA